MTKTKKSYDSFPIRWLDTTDSTNSDIRKGLGALANLSVIAARFQTAGRGQGDHTWLSPRDENLTFSILIRFGEDGIPVLPVADAVRISHVATLSIRDFLLEEGIDSRIKWPNDIWVKDRKICGMLIENILDGSNVGCSIVGIGINLNQHSFDPSLPNPVSLSMLTGRRYDLKDTLKRLYNIICRRVAQLGVPDGYNELEMEFNSHVFHLEATQSPQRDPQR